MPFMFQSTLPTRGSDISIHARLATLMRFNPRSPRGGATRYAAYNNRRCGVSIHAPHEGERLAQPMYDKAAAIVSIHAPHEGERL